MDTPKRHYHAHDYARDVKHIAAFDQIAEAGHRVDFSHLMPDKHHGIVVVVGTKYDIDQQMKEVGRALVHGQALVGITLKENCRTRDVAKIVDIFAAQEKGRQTKTLSVMALPQRGITIHSPASQYYSADFKNGTRVISSELGAFAKARREIDGMIGKFDGNSMLYVRPKPHKKPLIILKLSKERRIAPHPIDPNMKAEAPPQISESDSNDIHAYAPQNAAYMKWQNRMLEYKALHPYSQREAYL